MNDEGIQRMSQLTGATQSDTSVKPFAHLNAQNALLYRRVLGAFVAAKRRFVVHLRPDDVVEFMTATGGEAPSAEIVVAALDQLGEWGNLRADPDTSRVTTVEEFHRARYLYQMTGEGAAAETALAAYDNALGKRGALQRVALSDIAVQLRALCALAGEEPDDAKAYYTLDALTKRFDDLAGNAQAFMASLQRAIDLQDADVEAFLAYKDRLIEYLEQFIKDLVATGSEISGLIGRLDESNVDRMLDSAANHISRDAVPDGTNDYREREFARQKVVWQERWAGFRGWFTSVPGHPSQASLLRTQARAAVPRLLRVVAVLNDRRTGRSDRSADFRSLAVWFAQAPDDEAMHRLWRAAFGLQSSRHLTVDADTLAARDAEPVPANTPWQAAPPMLISPRLRQTGNFERRGKPNRVYDRSAQRRVLAERAAQEAAETAAARAELLAKVGPQARLSDIDELEPGAFRLFLSLLGSALAAKPPGRRQVRVTTSDGTMEVGLTELEGQRVAEIHTDAGVFRGPDHLIRISDLTAVREEAV